MQINAGYYIQVMSTKKLLPHAKTLHRNRNWVFQQDYTTLHKEKTAQGYISIVQSLSCMKNGHLLN